MDYIENFYLDIADEYDKKQLILRKTAREIIKDGLNKIPENLDCCYNCVNFCNKSISCTSIESEFSGKILSDFLGICYYYKNKN